MQIFSELQLKDLLSASLVQKRWHGVAQDDAVWRRRLKADFALSARALPPSLVASVDSPEFADGQTHIMGKDAGSFREAYRAWYALGPLRRQFMSWERGEENTVFIARALAAWQALAAAARGDVQPAAAAAHEAAHVAAHAPAAAAAEAGGQLQQQQQQKQRQDDDDEGDGNNDDNEEEEEEDEDDSDGDDDDDEDDDEEDKNNGPGHFFQLPEPLDDAALAVLEREGPVPPALAAICRIHNLGAEHLFGSYRFYDHYVVLNSAPLQRIRPTEFLLTYHQSGRRYLKYDTATDQIVAVAPQGTWAVRDSSPYAQRQRGVAGRGEAGGVGGGAAAAAASAAAAAAAAAVSAGVPPLSRSSLSSSSSSAAAAAAASSSSSSSSSGKSNDIMLRWFERYAIMARDGGFVKDKSGRLFSLFPQRGPSVVQAETRFVCACVWCSFSKVDVICVV